MVRSAFRTGKLIEVRRGGVEPRVSDRVDGRAHEIRFEGSDEPNVEGSLCGLARRFEGSGESRHQLSLRQRLRELGGQGNLTARARHREAGGHRSRSFEMPVTSGVRAATRGAATRGAATAIAAGSRRNRSRCGSCHSRGCVPHLSCGQWSRDRVDPPCSDRSGCARGLYDSSPRRLAGACRPAVDRYSSNRRSHLLLPRAVLTTVRVSISPSRRWKTARSEPRIAS